MIVEGK